MHTYLTQWRTPCVSVCTCNCVYAYTYTHRVFVNDQIAVFKFAKIGCAKLFRVIAVRNLLRPQS